MQNGELPRILVVDDEEAILETMTFTFMDVYEVFTSDDARKALEILDQKGPMAVVITDQRMPNMTGVEFLAQVFERHPATVRIMLTGFADAEATIHAINDGHVYAYVRKPWEPEELKQVVARAVEHYELSTENLRLVEDLRRSKFFLEAVMDRLETGALAVGSDGRVEAVNRPVRRFLGLDGSARGMPIDEIVGHEALTTVREKIQLLRERCDGENGEADGDGQFEEVELQVDGALHRLRLSLQSLIDSEGAEIGTVYLFQEVSHEPLRRRFDEVISAISGCEGELRPLLEESLAVLSELSADVRSTSIESASMTSLLERVSRTQTAIQNWLDTDDALARDDYPDAQLLRDRLRVAGQRWPERDDLPRRVRDLTAAVDDYYETGEKAKQRVL